MLFVEIKNAEDNIEFINADQITKVFSTKNVTRINMVDGSYVITKLWPDEVMEVIYEAR